MDWEQLFMNIWPVCVVVLLYALYDISKPFIKTHRVLNRFVREYNTNSKQPCKLYRRVKVKQGDKQVTIPQVLVCREGIFILDTIMGKGYLQTHKDTRYWVLRGKNQVQSFRSPMDALNAQAKAVNKLLSAKKTGLTIKANVLIVCDNACTIKIKGNKRIINQEALMERVKKTSKPKLSEYNKMVKVFENI